MADLTPGDFGRMLREARERRGASLQKIAATTKISVAVLDALERNDISRLPSGIFGRAFVRSYAVEVGLDPEEVLRVFVAQFPGETITHAHRLADQIEENDDIESKRLIATTLLRLLLLSAPLAGVIIYFATVGGLVTPAPRQELETAAPSSPADTPPLPSPPATSPVLPAAIEVPQPPSAEEVPQSKRLAVAVTAIRTCWVSAIVDGRKILDRTLQDGERQSFDVEREIVLTAADATAITMTLNGSEARPLGKAGEAVTTRLSPANFKDHLAAR